MTAAPASPYVPPEGRDPTVVAAVLAGLDAARGGFESAARRYRMAQHARTAAVRAARDAGLSHDEIAARLAVTRPVAIRLDQRTDRPAGPGR